MEIDDWIAVGGMGAYSIGPASEFNGMTALAKVAVWRSQEQRTINEETNHQSWIKESYEPKEPQL